MKNIFLTFLFFIIVGYAFAQPSEDLAITTDKGTKYIPTWLREGVVYVSISDFAQALNLNYYISETTGKVELKSNYYLLKSTPRSPYLILTPRSTGIPKVYQLPKSTNQKNGETFIPLTYSLEALEVIVERQLKLEVK